MSFITKSNWKVMLAVLAGGALAVLLQHIREGLHSDHRLGRIEAHDVGGRLIGPGDGQALRVNEDYTVKDGVQKSAVRAKSEILHGDRPPAPVVTLHYRVITASSEYHRDIFLSRVAEESVVLAGSCGERVWDRDRA